MLTTYPTLDKCTVALQSISWFRVVLDEMQEVRSSTTELARKCERLSCGRRWMVSGTPLYSSLADLRGELNFLRVSPFGAGHEDGFWQHVIAQPWAARSESALDAIELLYHMASRSAVALGLWALVMEVASATSSKRHARASQPVEQPTPWRARSVMCSVGCCAIRA